MFSHEEILNDGRCVAQPLRAPARAHAPGAARRRHPGAGREGSARDQGPRHPARRDVGVGTFYLHFPDKETLFDAVVEETVHRLKATVDAAREKARGPLAKIQAANRAFFRFARENREVFKIVFGHAAAFNDLIRRAQALFIADLEKTVREGITSGAFAPLPPALVAQAVVGMATQVISWWTEHESVPIETLIETTTALALHGITPHAPAKGARHG